MTIIVSRDYPAVFEELRQMYADGATVLVDRRSADDRGSGEPRDATVPLPERRRPLSEAQARMWSDFGYLVVDC